MRPHMLLLTSFLLARIDLSFVLTRSNLLIIRSYSLALLWSHRLASLIHSSHFVMTRARSAEKYWHVLDMSEYTSCRLSFLC